MKRYEYELIVDGKLLSRFWTKVDNGRDGKFIANAILNDSKRWHVQYAGVWAKETADNGTSAIANKTCYLEIVDSPSHCPKVITEDKAKEIADIPYAVEISE